MFSKPRPVKIAAAVVLRTPARQTTTIERSFDVAIDVRRRSSAVHDRRRSGQIAEIEARGPMIGVRMGVDRRGEIAAVVGENHQATLDPLLHRVDQRGPAGFFARDQVSLALAAIQLCKQHASYPERAPRPGSAGFRLVTHRMSIWQYSVAVKSEATLDRAGGVDRRRPACWAGAEPAGRAPSEQRGPGSAI